MAEAIQKIRAYHDRGRQSLNGQPERGRHGAKAIDARADALGWNATESRKARQFAHPRGGYSRDRLDELSRLLGEHRPTFGPAHVGLLVTVAWPESRGSVRRGSASSASEMSSNFGAV